MKAKNKEILGMDILDDRPNYSKTIKENEKEYREKYKKTYGKYPDENKD